MNETRQDKFVPLSKATATTKDRAEFSVTVLRDSQATPAFQPMGIPAVATPGGATTPQPHLHESQVTLQRDGDRITAIQIQCTCGRVIELGCVYQAPTGKS